MVWDRCAGLRETASLRGTACLAAGLAALALALSGPAAATSAGAGPPLPRAPQSANSAPSSPEAPSEDVLAQLAAKFANVYAAVEADHLAPVDPDHAILDGAVRGALSTLDPFSAFFDRDQFRLLQEQTRGQGLGFGSILYVQASRVLVLETAEGSPSWRAGLGPGDEIVEVNGTRLAGLDFDSLIALLQKARSGPVRLGVIHPGRVVAQDFELKPAEVTLPTVDKVFQLKPGVGYLHVSGFDSKTAGEVAQAIEKLEGAPDPAAAGRKDSGQPQPMSGLLLDLRDNHGGLVDAAIGVASLFLPPDSRVLTVRGRVQEAKTYATFAVKKRYDGPLVVLVNGDTASAAEVLAAALEEHDRAVIAGEPTYGKGVVESVMPLSDGTGLALTSGQYLTPSGRSLQRPLAGTALEKLSASAVGDSAFHTDDGRLLLAGGGVTPDAFIPARRLDPWLAFLDQRGAFTDFAADLFTLQQRVPRSFQPDARTLSDFKDFLRRSGVSAPDQYWNQDQDYLKLRLRTELMNLAYGLAVGDQVAAEGDPQVQRAADLFATLGELLKGSRQ
jgi:carboxyl-terminal processing protease